MNYKGFRIENEPAYVWRMHCWNAHADHNHIACWYVFDADGKRVAGGYSSGNNTQSGSAHIARRKDAKAWVDGYLAYHHEPENRKALANGTVVHATSYGDVSCCRDEREREAFDAGYWTAQRQVKKTA